MNPADQIAAGDAQAFERVFLAYANRLCRYINGYLRSWSEAEELVQDLFLAMWRGRAQLTGVRDFEGYLYTLARNRALSHLRHRQVEDRWSRGEEAKPKEEATPDTAESDELHAAIQRALDALPPRQREVLLLRLRDEATYDEIARRLGITEQSVWTHLRRATDRLRDLLPRLL